MMRKKATGEGVVRKTNSSSYNKILADVSALLKEARHASARAINSIMTATYWAIGRRIVEEEQGGHARAGYGKELIANLSLDLTARFGRGFGAVNLSQIKRFYLLWPQDRIFQTLSEKSSRTISQTSSEKSLVQASQFDLRDIANALNLSWSHYIRLLEYEPERGDS